ncbi:hypothetical protein [Variovorax boronicumulans]|uniref:hypothetical protein n=1 Tax=Variovorax boronicumulans TaxID=436515 RepID=UPI00339731B1
MKKWIANRHINRISHRPLETFEVRNPQIFGLSRKVFDSWAEAHEWLLECRRLAVTKRRRDLKNAERQLLAALAMKPKEAA